MELAFHEFTVSAVPFKKTTLPFCAAPKPLPEITTWLPILPVVAETLASTGTDPAPKLTDTLSTVAVANAEFVALPMATPIYTFCIMLTLRLAPICVQFTPSIEE